MGALANQNGGAGWSGAWDGGNNITSPGLSFTKNDESLVVAGNTATTIGNDTGNFRQISTTVQSGTEWISLLAKLDSGTGGTGYAGVSLFNGGNENLFIGQSFNNPNWGLNQSTGPQATSLPVDGTTHLFVVQIDYGAGTNGNDRVRFYVDPTPGVSAPDVAPAIDVSTTRSASFNQIRIQAGGGASPVDLDEVRIGTAFASVVPAGASTVYNNSPDPATWTSFQTVEQNWEIGDDVTLAGTARNVDQFQVYVTNQFNQAYTGTFTARFFTIGTDGLPATQLWQGTAHVTDGQPIEDRWVNFSVPNVLVPDRFIWAIQADTNLPSPSSTGSDGLGVVLNGPPQVGSSQDMAYANLGDGRGWYSFNYHNSGAGVASFGAKIDAIPTPIPTTLQYVGNGGAGFGGPVGNGTLTISDTSSVLNFSLSTGVPFTSNALVLYFDTKPGGVSDTSTFTDNGDGGRTAVSGYNAANTPPTRTLATFPAGFGADYALSIEPGVSAGLYDLSTPENFGYVGSANLAGAGTGPFTFSINRSDVGLGPSDPFSFVGTLISTTAYRSNETIGDSLTIPGDPTSAPNAGFTGATTFSSAEVFRGVQPVPQSPGLSASPGQTVSVTTPSLFWDVSASASEYGVYISQLQSNGTYKLIFDSTANGITIPGSATSFTVPAGVLQDGGQYRWNMNANINGAWGPYTNRLYFRVSPLPVPAAPAGLTATPLDSATMQLQWDPVSGTGITYKLFRGNSATGPWNGPIYATSNTATDYGPLQAGTHYYYTVEASNFSGDSPPSSPADASTPAVVTPPTPTNVSATQTGSNQITLTWDDVLVGVNPPLPNEYYEIQRSDGGPQGFQTVNTVAGQHTFIDTIADPSSPQMALSYQVIAEAGGVPSTPSAAARVGLQVTPTVNVPTTASDPKLPVSVQGISKVYRWDSAAGPQGSWKPVSDLSTVQWSARPTILLTHGWDDRFPSDQVSQIDNSCNTVRHPSGEG